jgi:hypothetical protein
MNGSQQPPGAPQAPLQGGRDWDALQSRAVRRLEARVAGEHRQAGETPLQRIPGLTTPEPAEVVLVSGRTRSRGTWLRTTVDVVLGRSGRRHRR